MWNSNGMRDWKENKRCSKAVTSAPEWLSSKWDYIVICIVLVQFTGSYGKKNPTAS